MEKRWISLADSCGFSKLPRLLYAGTDSVDDVSYRWDGAKRKSGRMCVFQYTIAGCGLLAYCGNTYKIVPGKAFIFDLSIEDSCYFYPPSETEPWSFAYCVFSGFEDVVEQLNAKNGPVYDFGMKSFIAEKIIAAVDSPEKRDELRGGFKGYCLCAEIVGEMCRLIESGNNTCGGSALVEKACGLIYESRFEPFSLKDLASSLGVCREHLCREFKRHLNVSPRRYYEKLRIEAVCERLLKDGASIKETARDFGYDDISNFNKFFKKCCATTPGKFRKSRTRPMHDMFNEIILGGNMC